MAGMMTGKLCVKRCRSLPFFWRGTEKKGETCACVCALLGAAEAKVIRCMGLRPTVQPSRASGPRAAAKELAEKLSTEDDLLCWKIESRIEAIVGSVAGSKKSVLSGIRAWVWFHRNVLRCTDSPFPPKVADFLRWSQTFANAKTFSNYCGYVKVACELLNVELHVFDHPSLRRAKAAVAKRKEHVHREPKFVRYEISA